MVSEVCDKSSIDIISSFGCFQMTFFQPEQLIQGFQQGFHCVIPDLKDLTSAELFQGIVTYNNYQGYCLDSSWTLWDWDFTNFSTDFSKISIIFINFVLFLNKLTFSPLFPQQGGKYMNKQWIWTIYWVFIVETCPRYPSQGTQAMLTQDKETKKVWTLQPKPSHTGGAEHEEQHEEPRQGAGVQPYPVIT